LPLALPPEERTANKTFGSRNTAKIKLYIQNYYRNSWAARRTSLPDAQYIGQI
jgi:hypothetical protein